MATMDPHAVNGELKDAREAQLTLQVKQWDLELATKLAFEDARTKASIMGTKDGKAPSEAACERSAKSDPTYLKCLGEGVDIRKALAKSDIQVEFLRRKHETILAMEGNKK